MHTAKPFLYTQIVSWVLLRQHIIASTFFLFVLFGNMEILLLVQKWCNASSNTKNSKKINKNKSSTLSLLKIPAPSLICLTEKPKKNHQDFTRQTASNWQILSVSHFHPSTNSSLTCWVENTQE